MTDKKENQTGSLAKVLCISSDNEVKPRITWEDYLKLCERERITPCPLKFAALLPDNEEGKPA